ncbi:hypothetical protein MARBORIA2_17380 [Methanobrevibacter arboriphilus]|jgi:cbb3-type cytochrome oxidase subunit 3|uniref:Uncharacterized protein n=1 Tax=Methanobrevibacter arboriphilus TaxID=39441 RepID=A0ACA8R1K9_METAZ|nr:hypothetical protein [Methanobrevibacter arboriphilus]BBL61009.1 hypothetical protein MarbSA_00490 [Methanobrevibacter arboriphilus]GLI12648.1 hypothetical protein MARBORIA2_17380 [Methanobrevibacter arboriphilus]
MDLDIGIAKMLILTLKIITLILLLGLFSIYRKSYKKIKIGYTIGLIVFALLLMIKSIIEISVTLYMISTGDPNLSLVLQDRDLLPATIEVIAIGVLYKITKDY